MRRVTRLGIREAARPAGPAPFPAALEALPHQAKRILPEPPPDALEHGRQGARRRVARSRVVAQELATRHRRKDRYLGQQPDALEQIERSQVESRGAISATRERQRDARERRP
jgi:hypothetical protein